MRLTAGLTPDRQERLLLQHEAIEWLLANVEEEDIPVAMFSKLRSLGFLLNWRIPVEADLRSPQRRPVFTPQPEVARRLREVRSDRPRAPRLNSKTLYDSRDYIAECMAADVPIPPSINVMDPAGLTGWKSQSFIPAEKQFIENTPAEVRTFQAPNGMCIALPRYVDATLDTVYLDGVICLSKTTSKVCFWDNQWTDNGRVGSFPIARTEVIPIGVPSAPGGKDQGGGREMEFGTGGVCTDCHAGEAVHHSSRSGSCRGATAAALGIAEYASTESADDARQSLRPPRRRELASEPAVTSWFDGSDRLQQC